MLCRASIRTLACPSHDFLLLHAEFAGGVMQIALLAACKRKGLPVICACGAGKPWPLEIQEVTRQGHHDWLKCMRQRLCAFKVCCCRCKGRPLPREGGGCERGVSRSAGEESAVQATHRAWHHLRYTNGHVDREASLPSSPS